MLLTDAQLWEIKEIIRNHHTALVVSVVGPEAVPPGILEMLDELDLLGDEMSIIEEAYLYGQTLSAAGSSKVANMSYDQFKAHLLKNPLPLSPVEERAVQWAKHHAAQHIVGLGNTVDIATGSTIIEADAKLRDATKQAIREKTSEAIAARKSNKQLKSDLGWMTKDWARDWDRIAITEMSDAFSHAEADQIESEAGEDALVFRRPMPDACAHCKRLHLGPDGAPRIFKLSTLRGNGTNFKKKAAEWLAIVGPIHPHCQCTLEHVPPGWGFNEQGELWPGGEFGVHYDSEAAIAKAIMEEDTLQKSIGDGRAFFQGLTIFIENPAGSVRKWPGGETKMLLPYGYIKGTGALDEDELDVYLGPDPTAEFAYVVTQSDPETGTVDEHKVFLGLSNERLAREYFAAHRDDGDTALFDCTPIPIDQFKRWIAGTEAAPGHMFQKSIRDENQLALVIPLQKSIGEDVTTTTGTFKGSQGLVNPGKTADRGVGPGVGMNYYLDLPLQHKQQPAKELIDAARELKDTRKGVNTKEALSPQGGIIRNPDEWEIAEPLEVQVHDVSAVTDDLGEPVDEETIKRNRFFLDKRVVDNGMGDAAPQVMKKAFQQLAKADGVLEPTGRSVMLQKSDMQGQRARVRRGDAVKAATVWRHDGKLYLEVTDG